MSLDAETPPVPHLDPETDVEEYEDADVPEEGDLKRGELQDVLEDGAWADAFDEWAGHTDLDEEEYAIVEDCSLLDDFEFFWDDFAGRVGYHAPGIPEDWRTRELHPALQSWETVSAINAALTELGRTVANTVEERIDWEAGYEAPDDLPDF